MKKGEMAVTQGIKRLASNQILEGFLCERLFKKKNLT